MSETDLPDEGTGNDTALSFNDGVAAIENLLPDDLETDNVNEDEGHDTDQEFDDDDLVLDDEADGESDEPETVEFKGGKFASDDAKVTLEDGSTISVADLKRNNLFQRDYTKKTQELSEQRRAFEDNQRQTQEYAQQLAQQREIIFTLANQYIPKEPTREMLSADPIGYMEAKASYDEQMGQLNRLWQSQERDKQHLTAQQSAQSAQSLERERARAAEIIPAFRTPEKFEAFRNDVANFGVNTYGYKIEELSSITDSRALHVIADAMAYRKAKAAQESRQVAPQAKPKIVQKQRMAPQAQSNRDHQQASARLAKTGSIDDAAKALMKFV